MKKNIIFSAALSIMTMSSFAQIDRSVQPQAGPAREPQIAEYESFTLDNGLKVFVVENHKLPRVTFSLVIDRDPVKEGQKAGMVQLAGDLIRRGTNSRTKDQIDEQIDFMGASLSTYSTGVYASSLSKYSEEVLEIMADVIMNASFPQEEFEKLLTQAKSGLESQKDDPSAIMNKVFQAMIYGKDHPYGEMMTEQTLENISVEDCKNYYSTYFRPNTAYLAVVGDVKPRKVKKLLKRYLGDWENQVVPEHQYKFPVAPPKTMVAFVNRDASVQSVIKIGNTIDLEPGNSDIEAVRVMNQILGGGSSGRLFRNLREDKAFTYGAYSSFDSDPLVGNFSASASVRNDVTDSAVTEFLYEFNRIRTEPVSEEELEAAKNNLAGSFGRSLESPNTVTSFAINIARYGLPKDYYNNYLKRLSAVTVEDVQRVANKYIHAESLVIGVVGRGSEVAGGLEKFGELKYFTPEAEPTSAPSLPVPDGVTADKVLSDYFAALGGLDKIKAVKSMKMTAEVSVPGMPAPLTMKRIQKVPGLFSEKTLMNGQVVQERTLNGEKASSTQMGQEKPMDEEAVAQMKKEASVIFDEVNYLSEDYSLTLDHMSMVNGNKAYVMTVKNSDGEEKTLYFDEESGLLVKSESSQETPRGPISVSTQYEDYQENNGVKYAMKMVQKVGPQTITIDVKELEINGKVSTSDL